MKNQKPRMGRTVLFALLIAGMWSVWGCGVFDPEDPETARVVIEGAVGHAIQLVTTNDFDITTSNDGEDQDIHIHSADTSAVTSPFDQGYGLGSRIRFYVSASSADTPTELVTVKIYIDDDLRYNRVTAFGEEVLEFAYSLR